MTGDPKPPCDRRDLVVARSQFAYQAHPHIAVAHDGTWLIVFNNTVRGEHIRHDTVGGRTTAWVPTAQR